MGVQARFWNRMYRGTPSWDLGEADPQLLVAVEQRDLRPPIRVLDIGCGTGDNAIALAERGFTVTAIDVAERALTEAHRKAQEAGVEVDLRCADVAGLATSEGPFDLVVDRGLLMSLFGERARRAYVSTLVRLTAPGSGVYQYQWELPASPRPPSTGWVASRLSAFVLAPGELERRLGDRFTSEVLARSVEEVDDPGMRRMGIRRVAKTSSWLQRRD